MPSPAALRASKKPTSPLYFLIFAAVVLAISVIAFFFVHIFNEGRSAATGSTAPASVAASTSESADAVTPVKEDQQTSVTSLADSTKCEASSDAQKLNAYAEKGSDYKKETLSTVLSSLSQKCGAEYTEAITTELKSSSTAKLTEFALNTSWWHRVSPVPHNAISASEFTTVQNNIRCKFTNESVDCSIYVYDYPSPDGCEGQTATYHLRAAEKVTADCLTQINTAVEVPYGSTVSNGTFWCTTSQSEGITCTSSLSGHGFQLKRSTDRIF